MSSRRGGGRSHGHNNSGGSTGNYDEAGTGNTGRRSVDRQAAARDFNGDVVRTKALNMAGPPMRGGYRL